MNLRVTFFTPLLLLIPWSSAQDPVPSVEKEFVTRVYRITPGMLEASVEDPRDPFRGSRSFEMVLKEEGVDFPEGAAIIYSKAERQLVVRNTSDALARIETLLRDFLPKPERQLFIILEMIEVDHAEFNDWLLSNRMESDATGLRRTVQEWVGKGRGTLLDTVTLMARSGQRAKIESVDEYTYPTEYDPPEIPNAVTLSDGATAPVTGVTPTAYDTRNLGVTLEVDPILNADGNLIDLTFAPEKVELAGFSQWSSEEVDELFKTTMPTFHLMKTTTQVTVKDGGYVMFGTGRPLKPAVPERTDPLVLQFVRVDVCTTAEWTIEEVK